MDSECDAEQPPRRMVKEFKQDFVVLIAVSHLTAHFTKRAPSNYKPST